MNKLLYVNIGGIVFQIDDNAYAKLDHYLNAIRQKYAKEPGGDDIIHDIELRIAEILEEKIGGNGAITGNHVDTIIAIMGLPSDFETDGDAPKSNQNKSESTTHKSTRFYRDTDNRVLGGVCAGFAARFEIDALWLRIAFLVTLLFFGTGILLYLILWIIMPEAKTTAEKIEMRGEKVTVNNIEKTIREEASQFKSRMNEFGEEVKQTFSKERIQKSKTNAGEIIEGAANGIKAILKFIVKFIVIVLMAVSVVVMVVIGVELISDHTEVNGQINFLMNHLVGDTNQTWILVGCGLSLIIIPFISILYSGSKYLLGIKKKFKAVDWTLLGVWLICFTAVIVVGIKVARNFKQEGYISQKIELTQPTTSILYVQMNALMEEDIIWEREFREDWNNLTLHDNKILLKNINISIERSADSNYAVIINKGAKGVNRDDAKSVANQFEFELIQRDSLLLIPSSILFKENELFRDQVVDISIRVPQGKYLVLDQKLDDYFDSNEISAGLTNQQLFGNKLKMTLAGLQPFGN